MNYLADSHISYALKKGAASKEIFKNLDDTYDRRSLPNQWSIERKINNLKLDSNTTSLLVHFEKFNDLITTLATARGEQIKEGDKIGKLLQSLPNEHNQVVTSIETMNESQEITYAFVKNRLLDHETKLKEINNDTSTKALISNAPENVPHSQNRNSTNRQRGRNFGNRINFRSVNFKRGKRPVECFQCGRKNHIKKDRWVFKKFQNYKNNRQQSTQANVAQQGQANDMVQINTQPFAFMVSQSVKSDLSDFIVDSGASHHMIKSDKYFESAKFLNPPILIEVAKQGEYIKATKIGSIEVDSNLGVTLLLENVLYSPELPQNLLSVKKMDEKGIEVTFKNGMVFLKRQEQVFMSGNSM